MTKRETIFSPCRKYRYTLWREWQDTAWFSPQRLAEDFLGPGKFVQFIGLNPSTADETTDDPTVRRCIDYAKRWGYGAMCMTNVFAFRATDPKEMLKQLYPVGEDNGKHIMAVAEKASLIVACWGATMSKTLLGPDAFVFVRTLFDALMDEFDVHHLGLTKDGHPRHPLYLKKTLKPIPYIL